MDSSVTHETTLPTIKDVRDLLTDLLGRNVDVQGSDAWAPTPADMAVAGEFVDDQRSLQVVVLLDFPLAVFAGASVGLVPAGGAKDMVKERFASAMVVENLYEVLNILASVFNIPHHPHVKLTTMYEPGKDFPDYVWRNLKSLIARLDLAVSVDGYGNGRLAFILAHA